MIPDVGQSVTRAHCLGRRDTCRWRFSFGLFETLGYPERDERVARYAQTPGSSV